MNEYVLFTHEDGSYVEGVHHIQLAYASYEALLALFKITRLLGVGTRGRRQDQGNESVSAMHRSFAERLTRPRPLTVKSDNLLSRTNDNKSNFFSVMPLKMRAQKSDYYHSFYMVMTKLISE